MANKSAVLNIEEWCTIAEDVILFVAKSVEIGKKTSVSFGSIITDSNSHFVINMHSRELTKHCSPIVIGDFNWICNNTSIKPGTRTHHHTIVSSSYTVLTKDYTQITKPYSVWVDVLLKC